MSESIFREKNLDRMKTPDNLDQYIQVANRGVWVLVVCILCLVVGAVIWSLFGTIEVTVDARAVVENNTAYLKATEEQLESVDPGMTVRIGEEEGAVLETVPEENRAIATINVPDGIYDAEIVTETIKPSALIFE